MGDLRNEGFDFNISYSPVRTRNLLVNVTLNGTRNHNTILKISDALQRYNDMVNANGSGSTTPVFLFKEGESMNTIYAVRSLGIDPGTGKELYIDRNGNTTYTWNAQDQVPVGVNEPTLNGYAGLNIRYKSWEIGTHLNYSFGADKYNYTLHQEDRERQLYDKQRPPRPYRTMAEAGRCGSLQGHHRQQRHQSDVKVCPARKETEHDIAEIGLQYGL